MSAVLPVTDGLVAAYDFVQGEDPAVLYDISGNGHHGTIIGGATWTDEGLQLDGETGYVNVGDLGSLGDGYTIVAVTKAHTDHWGALLNRISSTTSPSQNGYGLLLAKVPTVDRWGMGQYEDSELSRFQSSRQTSPGSTNRWTALCAQYGDGLLSLSVDDIPPSRAAIDTSFREHTGNYYLGRLTYTSAYYYNGSIAYLAVYDRKLSPAELDQVNRHVQAAMADRGIQVAVYIPMPPMVVFTMDDGVETDYTNAYRLAKERGIPLVSYICTNIIGNAGRLTWDQIREMRAAGFAIECHTHTHVDVTSLTEAELRANLEAVNAAFVAAGLPAPEHHSYPFGSSDEASRAIVAGYRETARATSPSSGTIVDGWACEKPGWTGWDRLRAWNVYRDATENVDDVKAKIDDAILKNQAVIFYTHDISDSPSTQGLHTDLFEEILDYVAVKRDAGLIEPVTIDGLYRAIQGIRTHPANPAPGASPATITLHGEVTGATYDKTVDYVGFVWGTTRHNNPEGTAPDAAGYDHHWISAVGDYREDSFSYAVLNYVVGTEYYCRAAARIDGTWYYGEELTYADSDTVSGTNGRYQAVTGTVAYDDANKRMNVTTATGTNGKASGRLKSYKFCEGAQQFDVTLPVGADGDFICMVTHATDPAMTNGIGVGLQSDGAGNWNLVTLSGTTVTVGAPSGLTDGKTARIEIEKDITGAYWYYIYDAAGTKPTTATGKLFTALSEGYTGWYANGNNKTYAIKNISIRAESIVGQTNVEVTEPFWFRDEFGEDSRGRYVTPGTSIWYDSENNELYSYGRHGIYITDHPTFIGETIVTIQTRNTGVTTDCNPCVVFGEPKKIYGILSLDNFNRGNPTLCVQFSPDSVDVYQNGVKVPGATSTAIKYQSGETQTFVVTYNGSNQITVSDGTNSITFTDDAFAVRTVFSAFIGTFSGSQNNGVENRFKLIEISGTRVYQKPIHRGAMLETYHDGTEEVVGTTFIDDCQWDRSAEWVKVGSNPVFDTTNGKIVIATGATGYITKCGSLSDGYYAFDVLQTDTSSAFRVVMVSDKSTDLTTTNGNLLDLIYYPSSSRLILREFINGVKTDIGSYTTTFNPNVTYRIAILKVGNVVRIYLDGIAVINATVNSQLISGVFGVSVLSGSKGNVQYSNIQIIAASPDATNSIAACIPPIGGGARYGVEESVYNTFTTENVNKGAYLTTAKVKTTNPNADEVSLEYTNDTTSITLNTTPIDVDATYTVKTTPITIDANETDTLRVSVKNSTTPSKPAIYVESLSLIPVSGDDVLYPQDLAFISGVKPSQKRKVEVK